MGVVSGMAGWRGARDTARGAAVGRRSVGDGGRAAGKAAAWCRGEANRRMGAEVVKGWRADGRAAGRRGRREVADVCVVSDARTCGGQSKPADGSAAKWSRGGVKPTAGCDAVEESRNGASRSRSMSSGRLRNDHPSGTDAIERARGWATRWSWSASACRLRTSERARRQRDLNWATCGTAHDVAAPAQSRTHPS